MKYFILFFQLSIVFFTAGLGVSQPLVVSDENDRGNRWEGYSGAKISSKFRLLSLLEGRFPKFKEGDELFVSFSTNSTTNQIQVSATKIKEIGSYYGMLAKKTDWNSGVNTFGPWPVDDVLIKHKVSYSNIGVLIKNKDTDFYYPAAITKDTVSNNFDKYSFFFYTPDNIGALKWEVLDRESGLKVQYGEMADFYPEDIIRIDTSMNDCKTGVYYMKLTVSWETGPISYSYEFFHQK